MKYVEGNFLPTDEKTTLFFGKTGNVLNEKETHKLPHYAKLVKFNTNEKENYYIRIYQSTPFDPMGPYGRRERNLDTQMKKVSRNTFDFYVTYLKTNNSIYLTKASRGFLND
jgi:hypothetical protein|tara:strand:+ start:3920 stop:4255 length:336 start_codon:yes stop_codon:yes gene_type:complete